MLLFTLQEFEFQTVEIATLSSSTVKLTKHNKFGGWGGGRAMSLNPLKKAHPLPGT
jgi:hypothetical protein